MDAARYPRWTIRWGVAATAGATAIALAACPAVAGAETLPSGTSGNAASAWSDGSWGDLLADVTAKDSYGRNAAQRDPGSLFTVERSIGARAIWNRRDGQGRNVTGQGVGVAVLDSGINQVPGLDDAGKVSYGPDLSIEENGPLADQDTYGHGTFMAGIIGGRSSDLPSWALAGAPADAQLGVAPDTELLALKLATTDGSTDVSQVIAALDWVTEHPVLPDGTPIRVINLSYGTDSSQPYQLDPLAAAAENAWRHGIVVVTSVGNSGTETGRVTDPAIDPYLLSVGAADSSDRIDGWQHDRTKKADFSSVGTDSRHADLLAPGTSLVSDRVPGSYVDENYPGGRVKGDTTGRLFRGSGTSQAAAVVTGAVADLLQAYPSLTPDQVKYALLDGAQPVHGPANGNGAGIINLPATFDSANHLLRSDRDGATARAAAVQSFPQSTGAGSIDAARAGSVLVDADGNDLSGEIDVMGNAWDPAAWYQASSTLTAWSGGSYLGTQWTGDDWEQGTGLSSARWSSARWSSARWSSARWSSARWSSARWSSARWSSARWSSARWSDFEW